MSAGNLLRLIKPELLSGQKCASFLLSSKSISVIEFIYFGAYFNYRKIPTASSGFTLNGPYLNPMNRISPKLANKFAGDLSRLLVVLKAMRCPDAFCSFSRARYSYRPEYLIEKKACFL